MASVKEHYDQVLSSVYSWMYGGYEINLERYSAFFRDHGLQPRHSGLAIDLGAGCGFQSIPLARAGFTVTAIDLDPGLLSELRVNAKGLPVRCIEGDLLEFDRALQDKVELIVCMTDTLLHLESKGAVKSLFSKVYAALEAKGRFVISIRDLGQELTDTDRFLPLRSDAGTIFTCFLEYEPDTVKVHDLVYRKEGSDWTLYKSFYRKLRLSEEWVRTALSHVGFAAVETHRDNGLITFIATRT